MDKFTRQLNLVALLQQAGAPLTFAEIRSRLPAAAYPQRDPESARRGFERDKADLLAMGVPLEAEPLRDDPSVTAYTVASTRTSHRRRQEMSDPGFTPSELAALRFAATAVALRGESVDSVAEASHGLRKYGGMGTPVAERTLADLQLDDNVSALFASILESAPVGFSYSGRTRRVLPVQLANRVGRWYLRAEDLDSREPRTYRLDRIEGPVLDLPPPEAEAALAADCAPSGNGESDPRPSMASLRLRPWEFGRGEAERVIVALDPPAAAVATAGDPDLEVLDEGPEGTRFVLAVRNPEGLFAWLLSFLDRAELLAPASMRDAYRAHLEDIVDETPTSGGEPS